MWQLQDEASAAPRVSPGSLALRGSRLAVAALA